MGKLTRQQAISAKCKDCIYDPFDTGTWLAQVDNCTQTDCPLYEYRPVPRSSETARKRPSKKLHSGMFGYKTDG